MISSGTVSETVRGASQPKGEYILSMVHKDISDDDMKQYITTKNVNGVELTLVSNVNAMFKSYKLSVPLDEKDKILQYTGVNHVADRVQCFFFNLLIKEQIN